MSAELTQRIEALEQDVGILHIHWNEFITLFGSGSSNVDRMNDVAPFFFFIVQELLLNHIYLGISRLTDPARSANKHSNLSLFTLIDLMENDSVKKSTLRRLEHLKKNASFAIQRRHKLLSHRDLDHALDRNAEPFLDVTREKIESCLAEVADILNDVNRTYQRPPTAYGLEAYLDGADSLAYWLKRVGESQ